MAAFAGLANAQAAAPKRIYWATNEKRNDGLPERVRKLFAALGLVEGRDFVLTFEEGIEHQPEAVVESNTERLIRLRPDAFVLESPEFLFSLRKRTQAIPIVFYNLVSNPVEVGIVESHNRPGQNVTGTWMAFDEMLPKFWELLKELKPSMRRAGLLCPREIAEIHKLPVVNGRAPGLVVSDPMASAAYADNPLYRIHVRAAATLGVELFNVWTPAGATASEIAAVVRRERVEGLWVAMRTPGSLEFTRTTRIPTVANDYHHLVKDGGAIAGLAWQLQEGEGYAVRIVHRLLQGEAPATIPVYRMNQWRLELNLSAARRAGIEVPPALRVRANDIYP